MTCFPLQASIQVVFGSVWVPVSPHGTQNNLNRCLQRETHHTQENALEKSNYWRDWNPHRTQNNLNRCLQRETHHTSRKRTGKIKPQERLEPTQNQKQPESMLAKGNTSHIKKTHWKNQATAKGNTSHIKKTHWKNQTTGETGTHTEPNTT